MDRTVEKHTHTAISFNYDICLEYSLSKMRLPWKSDTGYTNPHKFVLKKRRSNVIEDGERGATSTIQVLKPHGSANWFVPMNRRYSAPIVQVDVDGRPTYLTVGEKESYAFDNNASEAKPERYVPFIIPPLEFKGVAGDFMRSVYKDMQERLHAAHAIVIVGWSMPTTDQMMRQRISDAIDVLADASHLEQLLICDLNPTNRFYERYASIIPAKTFREPWKEGFTVESVKKAFVSLSNDLGN